MKVIRWFIFLGSLFFCLSGYTQNPRSHLIFYDFGTVDFNVNSLYKYQNGMELSNWNLLAVSFEDTVDSGNTWKLQFMASASEIQSDGSSTNLDLATIELLIEDGGGTTDLTSYIEPSGDGDDDFDLQAGSWVTVISGAPQGSFKDNRVRISYKCGKGSVSLMNKSPDYYTVDIYYRLSETVE